MTITPGNVRRRIGCISGGRVVRQPYQMQVFKRATDAASEGLNLQQFSALINYDLPWNPMRVEQRIGRIDRIGQEAAIVTILNLYMEATIEEDAYYRSPTVFRDFDVNPLI